VQINDDDDDDDNSEKPVVCKINHMLFDTPGSLREEMAKLAVLLICQTPPKATKLWSHHEETREKEILQGTMPAARRRGRPHTAWMDNIKTWTGLSVEESIRMTEDRDKWRKYVHGVASRRTEDG